MEHKPLSDRTFGLAFAGVFCVIGGIGWWMAGSPRTWPFVVAAGFAIVATVLPDLLLPLNRLWGWLTSRLGRGVNHLILGLVFYLLVVPFAAALRLGRRDPLGRRSGADGETYLAPVGRVQTRETLKDMF